MKRTLLAAIMGVLAAIPVAAQDTAAKTGTEEEKDKDKIKREEVVVVSASKVETTLVNAPVTMSVITSDTIASSPAQNYGDLLREVPGVNVIQMSNRDINLTSRQSTNTLSNSQLALLDGRSIYLDFFGLILWDLVPTDMSEIKQIEVVRGPASAVWGANALTGVVNIITKSPRETVGNTVTLNGGLFDREQSLTQPDGNGYNYGANFRIARAPSETLSWKLTGGYFNSDPYSRPEGTVPLDCHPFGAVPCRDASGATLPGGIPIGGAPYPLNSTQGPPGTHFQNSSTSQPKVDLRVDQDFKDGGRVTYESGYAGTSGIIHTGIGPFDIDNGGFMAYGKVNYSKGALKINGFANFLDVPRAPNLLFVDPATLAPVLLKVKTQTYDFEIGHSTVVGGHHLLSYGGNARRNNFDISLAPDAEDRNEFGAYAQDEIFYDKFRFAVGGRVDKFGNISDAVFSPRITAMFKPTPDHSFRVSFNRAFRSPSTINNFLDQEIFNPSPLVDLRPLVPLASAIAPSLVPAISSPFALVVRNVGNTELTEESLNAYELAYTGTFNKRTTVGLAIYRNDSNKSINFTRLVPSEENPQGLPGFDVYTVGNAPPTIGLNLAGVPVPGPQLIGFLGVASQIVGPLPPLPRTVSKYLNLSGLRQEGLEASINHTFNHEWSGFANYSYQKDPERLAPDAGQIQYPIGEVGIPAKNRFNAGVNWNTKRFLGSASVNYSDKALWTDVLSSAFDGYTDSYTMVNATFAVLWNDGKITTSVKGTNLFNESIQQHNYGDILKRAILAEVKVNF
jgi:outer membrane receptor protein involved in Fe transport